MKFWFWFLQRITGLAIVLLVFIHVGMAYFGTHGDAITLDAVQSRMRSALFWVDLLLLYGGLFHGLYGLYVVMGDLLPHLKGTKAVVCFALVGVFFACMGTRTLTLLL